MFLSPFGSAFAWYNDHMHHAAHLIVARATDAAHHVVNCDANGTARHPVAALLDPVLHASSNTKPVKALHRRGRQLLQAVTPSGKRTYALKYTLAPQDTRQSGLLRGFDPHRQHGFRGLTDVGCHLSAAD